MHTSTLRKYYTCEESEKSIQRIVLAKNTKEDTGRLALRKRGIANAIQVMTAACMFVTYLCDVRGSTSKENCVKGPNNLLEQRFLALWRAIGVAM
jgi:hypothetical protein